MLKIIIIIIKKIPKQYVQNGIRVNSNFPMGASASCSYALDEASSNQNNGGFILQDCCGQCRKLVGGHVPGMASLSEFSA